MRKEHLKKRVIAGVLVTCLLIAGITGKIIFSAHSSKDGETSEKTFEKGEFQKEDMTSGVSGQGTTTGGSRYQLYDLNLAGVTDMGSLKVAEVAVTEGDSVKQGDILIKLTPASVKKTTSILKEAVVWYQKEVRSAKLDYEEALFQAESEYKSSLTLESTALLNYQNTLKGYSEKVTQAKTKLTGAQKSIKDSPGQCDKIKKQIAAKRESIQAVEKKLSAQRKKVNSTKNSWNQIQKSYETAQQEYQKLQTVSDYLTGYQEKTSEKQSGALLQTISGELAAAKKAAAEQKTKYENVRSQLVQEQNTLIGYEQKVEKENQEINTLTKQLENSETSLSEAKKNLPSYRSAYHKALSEQTVGKVTAKLVYEKSVATCRNAETVYQNAVSEAEDTYAEVKESLKTAKERKEAFEQTVKNNAVTASQSGTLSAISYEKGDTLDAQTPIAEYYDGTLLNIDVTVGQNEIGSLKVGQNVQVRVMSYREQLEGTIMAIAGESSSESVSDVSYTVTVSVDNSSGKLSSGTQAVVSFEQ